MSTATGDDRALATRRRFAVSPGQVFAAGRQALSQRGARRQGRQESDTADLRRQPEAVCTANEQNLDRLAAELAAA